ncbi:phosphatase PAP2 family protein [Pontibacter anaerobius]|uniref:Phosphatase PAP2 family protein n=1 Tax=Pontibacter anaerobius TaxID=2993940 RepID=A0ABT3RAF4_9BACT|nr:phosphatase PAP2 family protein [Pontibacter anaerobius]MCX2738423.1 phosphatase PAP2 family protein [Pontibacter anaerobius]
MKRPLWLFLVLLWPYFAWGQTTSPYKVNWLRDGGVTVGAIGATVAGNILIEKKDRVNAADLAALSKYDVNKFDRFAAGNYSSSAETVSDFPFYSSFLTPLLLLLDKDVRQNAPEVYLLYGQALSIAGGMYSMTAGVTKRKRPYVYAVDAPLELKTDKQATNSFYAGHTAATATATFFLAKVYHDFNPDSPARPYIWAAAATVPAAVGYLRIRAGKHFLSDNIIGYGIGTAIGILVPELHRVDSRFSLVPESDGLYDGMAVVYRF